MSDLKELVATGAPDEKQSFSFSSETNGVTKSVRGEQVENGWIVTIEKEWTEGEGNDKEWKSDRKKFITIKDPRKPKEEKEEECPIASLLNSIASSDNMIIV